MKQFLDKYKVLLTGLAAAILVALQQFVGEAEVSWKALAIAVLLAAVGFIGNYLRGQYISMAGLIGVAVMTITEIAQGGKVNWPQVAISAAVALLTMVSPPPKPREYEHDPTIVNAKQK